MPIVKNEADKDKILSACQALHSALGPAGVRSKLDDRLDRSPGFKFNDYEMRGTFCIIVLSWSYRLRWPCISCSAVCVLSGMCLSECACLQTLPMRGSPNT